MITWAVALGAISLVLLAVTAAQWPSAPRTPDADGRPPTAGWRGGIILFAVSLLLLGSLWAAATSLGWNRDRVMWVGLGAFLATMTLGRPWWFWDNYRARWLRDAIGDEPTAALYLALSAVLVWVGLFTNWPFGRR